MDAFVALIIASPSGAGKTTLTKHLLATLHDFAFSVSHTTRAPREGEVDGRDYHFIDRAAFDAMVAGGGFAEWARVHDNLYGTSLEEIERAKGQGKTGIVFDIDVQGARQFRAKMPEATTVFVLPPNLKELRKRLEGRGQDAPEVIDRRMARAREEIGHYGSFDYLIVNDDLEQAKASVVAIARAEQVRRARGATFAETLLASKET